MLALSSKETTASEDSSMFRNALLWVGIAVTTLAPSAFAGKHGGSVSVRGYYRSNGTYVQPHMRSAPDGVFSNNWSTKGNVNPYTGVPGTKVAPGHSATPSWNNALPAVSRQVPSHGEPATDTGPAAGATAGRIASLTEKVIQQPGNAFLWSERAFEHHLLGSNELALADYTRAIELNRGEHRYYHNRGRIYLKLGQPDRAITEFNEAVRLNPSFSQAYLGLGDAYRLKGSLLASSPR
jgi:tetratricopeptide (TPR) repeat protein